MRIDHKKYKINNENINIKIAHISDIHFSHNYKQKRLDMIEEKLRKIKPDYICITGDLIDIYDVINDTNFKDFKKWIQNISKISKIIISIGNHEYIKLTETGYTKNNDINWLKKLQNERIIILDNEIYKNNKITFIGYNPSYEYYYDLDEKHPEINNDKIDKLIDIKDNTYKILLIHTPMVIVKNNNYKKIKNIKKINLILSGHTHGGLIPSFIPGHFGIISPCREPFPKKVRGKIKINNNELIISSGIMKLSRKSKITFLNDIYGANINEINITN
jgi:hypothetical protein